MRGTGADSPDRNHVAQMVDPADPGERTYKIPIDRRTRNGA